jgi:hypothetical protein
LVDRVRLPRVIVAASVAFGALAIAQPGAAADASRAELPPALSRVSAIERIFPDLYLREAARKADRSWERLRRMARTRWMRTNPCKPATLNRRYVLGASSWSIVERTWRCSGMSEAWIATRRCLADHEGGRTYPDVRYGGGRGYPGVPGSARNVVFGHLQIRPGWYRGALEGRRGTYTGDYWSDELYRFARHPVNQALTAIPIGTSHYATAWLCS